MLNTTHASGCAPLWEDVKVPDVTRFRGPAAGPSVVILGGIHGNEPCGVIAVERLESLISAGEVGIAKGTVTLIRGNREALQSGKRFVIRNLNRLFRENTGVEESYELQRAEQLKPLLAEADFVLDLHSASEPTPPFIICEEGDKKFATLVDVEWVVVGWAALDPALDGDTCTWASRHGAQALTLECGQHQDTSAPEVGFSSAMRVLTSLGMLTSSEVSPRSTTSRFINLYHAQILSSPGFEYARCFRGFDFIEAQEVIGRDSNGEVRAPRASRIVLPSDPTKCSVGTEFFLLGHEDVA